MLQYQVISNEGQMVFVGYKDQIIDELEIELDRLLEYGLLLHLEEVGHSITLHLSKENILPYNQIVKMISEYLKTDKLIDLTQETLFSVLGVSRFEACY